MLNFQKIFIVHPVILNGGYKMELMINGKKVTVGPGYMFYLYEMKIYFRHSKLEKGMISVTSIYLNINSAKEITNDLIEKEVEERMEILNQRHKDVEVTGIEVIQSRKVRMTPIDEQYGDIDIDGK